MNTQIMLSYYGLGGAAVIILFGVFALVGLGIMVFYLLTLQGTLEQVLFADKQPFVHFPGGC
jgi:hypothetical protein